MGITVDIENGIYTGASDSSSPDGAALGYWQLNFNISWALN